MPHPAEDDLALLALGEAVPTVEQHVRGCGSCAGELHALRSTVAVARGADLAPLAPPPPDVWRRIADELQLGAAPEPLAEVPAPVRRLPWRRPLLTGAAALAAAAAAVVVTVVVTGPGPASSVPLQALGEVRASGEVVLPQGDDGRSLVVETSGLPEADGSYEVWLLDLDDDRLVALGVLDEDGQGRLTVPEGVRVADFPVVDVSLEPDDGDPSHSGDSVLRGDLPG